MAEPSRSRPGASRPTVAPDRLRISGTRLWVMTVLCGVMVWAALSSLIAAENSRLSSSTMAQASAVVAVLAVFGLRSVPVRYIVRGLALVSGALLARFGQLGGTEGLSGSWRVLAWLAALGVALTLAPSSRSVVVNGATDPRDRDGNGTSGQPVPGARTSPALGLASATRGRVPLAIAVAMVSLVVGVSLLLGPRAANWFPVGARASDLVNQARNREDNVLVSREALDMTSRPSLTDKIVMTVRSPLVSFWRAELFDQWDGATWTRSYARQGRLITDGTVTAAPDDIAATKGRETTQEFTLKGGFANVLPAAPSPVGIVSSGEIAQRTDGTLVSLGRPLGGGTSYSVRSRQMPLDPDVLRAAGSARSRSARDRTAALVLAQYAAQPVATPRVVELARRETAPFESDFDKIVALERWMSANTTYSLEAPLSPKGVDVVDHFLFESRQGWCEQIASSLVVMARVVGIPARLATGYAPGEWDSAGSRFIVRERDAHAWAEVWFPDQGWVPFDPTAQVPLAGTAEAAAGASARDWRDVFGIVLVVVGMIALVFQPALGLAARMLEWLRHRRRASRMTAGSWELRAARRLERLGTLHGRPRDQAESLTRYGRDISSTSGDERFGTVGETLDRALFGGQREADPVAGQRTSGAAEPASTAAARGGRSAWGESDRDLVEGLLEELERTSR